MKTVRETSKLFIVLLFIVISFAAGCEPQEKYELSVELSKPANGIEAFEANTKNGDIVYNGDQIESFTTIAKITATAITKEKAQKLAEETKVSLEQAENKVAVKIEKPDTKEYESVSVSLDILGPKAVAVDFVSKNGDIVVNQINKKMKVVTKNGDIKACAVGLNATAVSKNGDIRLDQIGANVIAKTKNGDIMVQNVKGNSDIVSKNGDINLSYEPVATEASNISIVNKNGSIDLKAPRWDSAKIDLATKNGRVDCQYPVQFQGKLEGAGQWTVGDGKNKLKITTKNGNIKIH